MKRKKIKVRVNGFIVIEWEIVIYWEYYSWCWFLYYGDYYYREEEGYFYCNNIN